MSPKDPETTHSNLADTKHCERRLTRNHLNSPQACVLRVVMHHSPLFGLRLPRHRARDICGARWGDTEIEGFGTSREGSAPVRRFLEPTIRVKTSSVSRPALSHLFEFSSKMTHLSYRFHFRFQFFLVTTTIRQHENTRLLSSSTMSWLEGLENPLGMRSDHV